MNRLAGSSGTCGLYLRYRIYKFHAYHYLYRLRKASSGVQGRRRRFCLFFGIKMPVGFVA